MAYELVAQGGILDAADLASYEDYFGEGDNGVLELNLRISPPTGVAQELENALIAAGVEGARVTTGSPKLLIYYTKGFPWLAIIAAVILGLIVLAILIVGWSLWKEVIPDIPGAGFLTWGVLLAIGVILVIASTRRKKATSGSKQ